VLSYPNLTPPARGELVRVADGVEWLRMPLPMELDHINLWLLDHDGGYILIDTGLATDDSRAAWESLERTVLATRPLRLIVITHLHPDHAGLAAWLQERHRIPVWTSVETEMHMRRLEVSLAEAEIDARCEFFRSHGLADAESLRASLSGERYRAVVSGVPQVEHRPNEPQEVVWGSRSWRWLATAGHAAGHLCLHEAAQRLLIAGDQILPTISPNVGLTSWSGDSNPLASYLHSLERLAELDRQTLVLPSHGRPFFGLRERALELREHHERHLSALLAACAEPLTAFDCLRVLFRRTLNGFHRFLAMAEAIAHLEYLATAERLARVRAPDGTLRYVRAAAD
jgi:glyoxylase-like metal-dependent hydrolase (beta-lactamase superfamily II)